MRYAQTEHGHRSGIEPVFLAAAVPARPGERVLEAGTGAGAGLLCLAARVPDIVGVGVELEPALAELARRNFSDNGAHGLRAVCADIETFSEAPFGHAMANPPWHAPSGTRSPDTLRAQAHHAEADTLHEWVAALARLVQPRGTLTLVLAAGAVPDALAACARAHCGSATLFPLWPRQGVPAKIVLLHAVQGGRGAFRLLPGMVLHEADGRFTAAAEAVLRGGEPIPMHAPQRRRGWSAFADHDG